MNLLQKIKLYLNPWRKASELPEWNRENPHYSYDLVLHDGARKIEGYYSFDGQIYFAYDEALTAPVKKWKYREVTNG